LTELLRAIDPEAERVEPIRYGPFESLVDFEWIGLASPLEGRPLTRGANATSADAVLISDTKSGARCGYLLEWKYVEYYGASHSKGVGRAGDTRRRRYQPLLEASDSPFHPAIPLAEFLYEPIYQLMRLQLLGAKMVREHELGITSFHTVVVCPEDNLAYRTGVTSPGLRARYPSANTLESAFRATLRQPAGFIMTSPERLIAAIRANCFGEELGPWLEYQYSRYGW
jgi:hypothetical protein